LYLNTYDNGDSTSYGDIVGNTIVPISVLTNQGPTTLTVDVSINATYGYNSQTSVTLIPNYNGPDGGSGTSTCLLVTIITLSDGITFSFDQVVDCASYQLRMAAPPEGDSTGDCPETDGGIAITLDDLRYDIIESLGISGTIEGKYILKLATLDQLEGVSNYIDVNTDLAGNVAQEAKDFGKEAVRAWLDGFNDLTFDELFEFEQDYKNRMSASEKAIFDSMSRFNQLGYLLNAQKATWRAEDLFPNSLYNGKGDAFRHAYWNGLNVILLGQNLAESLTTAHEDKPPEYPYSYKEKQMDLFNNEVGRNRYNFLSDGFSSLEQSILDALNTGQLRYLNNLDFYNQATSSSQLIPTNQ
jgi:hypothetical protein